MATGHLHCHSVTHKTFAGALYVTVLGPITLNMWTYGPMHLTKQQVIWVQNSEKFPLQMSSKCHIVGHSSNRWRK